LGSNHHVKKPPYLKTYKDRHGTLRAYFRKAGQAQVPLPLPLYIEEFWKAYHAAKAGAKKPEAPQVGKAKPGSVSALASRWGVPMGQMPRECGIFRSTNARAC
jgi:hypothetical protein